MRKGVQRVRVWVTLARFKVRVGGGGGGRGVSGTGVCLKFSLKGPVRCLVIQYFLEHNRKMLTIQ